MKTFVGFNTISRTLTGKVISEETWLFIPTLSENKGFVFISEHICFTQNKTEKKA